jgi:catechol 2,3-dioxygenase-like lactoylglutathione lyase family enzyme
MVILSPAFYPVVCCAPYLAEPVRHLGSYLRSRFSPSSPNLFVASVERSVAFYTDVLGFERGMMVPPDGGALVFASVTNGPVAIFFNDAATAANEYPELGGKPLGATGTMFIEVVGVDALHTELQPKTSITSPLVTQWYGMREFAIADPDGYMITFAERVGEQVAPLRRDG